MIACPILEPKEGTMRARSRSVNGALAAGLCLLAPLLGLDGCYLAVKADPDELLGDDAGAGADTVPEVPLDGVDLLVVIDDSGSMAEEQAILAGGLFAFVDALVHPPPAWPYGAIDSMHLAVVTSDLGVSYGEDGEIPGESITPDSLQTYLNQGDGGWFQGVQAGSVTLGGTSVACEAIDGAFAETPYEGSPNASLTVQAACLAQQGTAGCGFEQQLEAAAMALRRDDQASFVEESHLLVVLVITDEEDCSMEDAPGLFATEECLDATKLNIACNAGGNEQYLFDLDYFRDTFEGAKGFAGGVIFAAIAGVPNDAEGAEQWVQCQGRGDEIGGCLDLEAMQMSTYVDDSSGTGLWKFAPVCTRSEGGVVVTSAVPGRRYVELAADELGHDGYVSSICNEDWSPAFYDLAEMIDEKIAASQAQ
jgi:hypothetical protein